LGAKQRKRTKGREQKKEKGRGTGRDLKNGFYDNINFIHALQYVDNTV
jgi:hypothetical protein